MLPIDILITLDCQLSQDKLAWVDPRSNRGYLKVGRERATTQSSDAAGIAELRSTAFDTKETMEIGRDWDKTWNNRWPQEDDVPGFRQPMLSFFQVCSKVGSSASRS